MTPEFDEEVVFEVGAGRRAGPALLSAPRGGGVRGAAAVGRGAAVGSRAGAAVGRAARPLGPPQGSARGAARHGPARPL